MSESEESFSDSAVTNLYQKALFVQPAPRTIDLNTVPADGNEFIHKSRLEDALLQFDTSAAKPPKTPKCSTLNKHWIRKAVSDFSFIANELKSNREMLLKLYPSTNYIPVSSEKECCTYCLGTEKCSLIYESDPCSFDEEHLPLLGDLIHLSQSSIFTLIKYHFKWFKLIGMEKNIHLWIFALFLCITKPISHEREELFEDLYDAFKAHLDDCEEEELIKVHLLTTILEYYFCINLDCSLLGKTV